jgi:hypothetical protein
MSRTWSIRFVSDVVDHHHSHIPVQTSAPGDPLLIDDVVTHTNARRDLCVQVRRGAEQFAVRGAHRVAAPMTTAPTASSITVVAA